MKAHRVIWKQKGVAELQPTDCGGPGDTQITLRTHLTLISPGTERAFFLALPGAEREFPQATMGYSAVGEVVAAGKSVRNVQVGDRVACDGNHASHQIVEADRCFRLPDGLADEEAVFFHLAAIALQGIRKARIELGESVCVIGAGLIGLLATQLAKLQGALPSICVDRSESRLAFARQVGADETLVADDRLPQLLGEKFALPPVVIEATGSPQAIPLAFAVCRNLGRVVLLGSTRGETEQVNFYRDVHKKGLNILGAHNSIRPLHDNSAGMWRWQDDVQTSLKLLAAGRLKVRPLITHRYPWRQCTEAYARLATWDEASIGMILNWREE